MEAEEEKVGAFPRGIRILGRRYEAGSASIIWAAWLQGSLLKEDLAMLMDKTRDRR